MQKTKDLFTTADVKQVRQQLIAEQAGLCAATGVPTRNEDFHLDHAHDSEQLVRGALHKQANMMLGKIENLHLRYLAYWYPHGLPDFLRKIADYLEKPHDKRFRHPGWMKKIQVEFNKLNEQQKKAVLRSFQIEPGPNAAQRKLQFQQAIKSKQYGFEELRDLLIKTKE